MRRSFSPVTGRRLSQLKPTIAVALGLLVLIPQGALALTDTLTGTPAEFVATDDPDKAAPKNALDQAGKVRFGGILMSRYIDFGEYGPNFPDSLRFRPWNQLVDLQFMATPVEKLEALAIFRLENTFGGYWGDRNIYGVRRLFIKGDYPVYFELGDYNAKWTPLTLQTFDDEELFEADFFQAKKRRIRNEVYLLKDSTWPLSGYRIGTNFVFDEAKSIKLNLESIGARLGVRNVATDFNTFLFDQYLLGVMAKMDVTKEFNFGGGYMAQFDVHETWDTADQGGYSNRIGEANAQLNLWPEVAELHAEWAISRTNTQTGYTDYFSDQAAKVGLSVDTPYVRGNFNYSQVGGDYAAPGAQTRLRAASVNPPFVTENNTWDATSNFLVDPPIVPHFDPDVPLTRYNSRIIAVPKLSYYPFENNTFPYGEATPNREAFRLFLASDAYKDYVVPAVQFVSARELVDGTGDGKRNFTYFTIGAKGYVGVFTLLAGYQLEDTNNQNHIAFTTTTWHGGVTAKIVKGVDVYAGYKHRDFNGSEFIGNTFYGYMDGVIDQYGVEVRGDFIERVQMHLGYQFTKVLDFTDGSNNYDAHEIDFYLQYEF